MQIFVSWQNQGQNNSTIFSDENWKCPGLGMNTLSFWCTLQLTEKDKERSIKIFILNFLCIKFADKIFLRWNSVNIKGLSFFAHTDILVNCCNIFQCHMFTFGTFSPSLFYHLIYVKQKKFISSCEQLEFHLKLSYFRKDIKAISNLCCVKR